MAIETFAVCYNEEKILPYFLRHYLQYGAVTIFDNNSTDNSVEIAKQGGVTIYQFNSDGEFREDILMRLRNECWKDSKADWVMVVDIDEFIYHKDLVTALEKIKGTVILPRMFNMYSDTFPTTEGQIYDEVKWGTEFNSKMSLFRPLEIKEMNYDPGCHFAHPEGNFDLNFTSDIIELHYKNLSPQYVYDRNKFLNSRRSSNDKLNNWAWHLDTTAEKIDFDFIVAKTKLIKCV
jgi:glycosyltransferase involved in cell wall biosynthesis